MRRAGAHALEAMQAREQGFCPESCVGNHYGPRHSGSCSDAPALRTHVQCRLSRDCAGCHYDPCYGSSCSEMPALRAHIEIRCRTGAHAMRTMQALGRLSIQSCLQQLVLRSACLLNSIRDHVHATCRAPTADRPSRCSCLKGRQALRRQSLRPVLWQLTLRDVCSANSNRAHVPNRCSGKAGYAATAWAIATALPTTAHCQRCRR